QRNVPAAPEVGDAVGMVRRVEVADQLEAEHHAQPHGHDRIAVEVEENLEGVCQHPPPGVQGVRGLGREHCVRDLSHGIGQQDLHGESQEEKQQGIDRKSTRLNSSNVKISYAVLYFKKKNVR